MIRFFALIGALVSVLLLSACLSSLGEQAAPPAPDVNITNVQPASGEGGLTILLTITGIAVFILLGLSIVGWMKWCQERDRRRSYGNVIFQVTGVEPERLVLTPGGDFRVPAPYQPSVQVSAHRMLTPGTPQ